MKTNTVKIQLECYEQMRKTISILENENIDLREGYPFLVKDGTGFFKTNKYFFKCENDFKSEIERLIKKIESLEKQLNEKEKPKKWYLF